MRPLMSGLATNKSIVLEYGLQAFLPKPFTMTDMLCKLAELDE
jgi:hypothetical protein